MGSNHKVLLRGFEEVIISRPGAPNSTAAQTNGVLLRMLEISPPPGPLSVASCWHRAWAGMRDAEGPGCAEEPGGQGMGPAMEGVGQTCMCEGFTPGDQPFSSGSNLVNPRLVKPIFIKWAHVRSSPFV